MNKRMDRKRLNIGTYHLKSYAQTDSHIAELAACGIDFIVCLDNNRKTLDLCEKHGVGAVVTGVVPGWWGGDGGNAGTMERSNPLEKYDDAAKAFEDHPAVWGIDIGDEPSALDFPHYGKVFARVDRVFEDQFPYINLYPNYASVAKNTSDQTVNQLGTETYPEHIAEYCKNVPADYICFDFYPYSINVTKFYENLFVVADAARDTGRSMWIVLQVNSHVPEKWISTDQLRFQAFASMAFGAENIIWACYTAGWWHNQVLDESGEKTEQYEKLKLVNGEIRRLAESFMKYRRVNTYLVGQNADFPCVTATEKLNTGLFKDVKASDGSGLIVGSLTLREGNGSAIFVCSAPDADEEGRITEIEFAVPEGRTVRVIGNDCSSVIKREGCSYKIPVRSSGAVLIELCR